MYKENFPERIKKARKDADLTQTEVADELKISKGTVSKYETGKLEPDLEKLAALANLYDITIDWLLGIGKS